MVTLQKRTATFARGTVVRVAGKRRALGTVEGTRTVTIASSASARGYSTRYTDVRCGDNWVRPFLEHLLVVN